MEIGNGHKFSTFWEVKQEVFNIFHLAKRKIRNKINFQMGNKKAFMQMYNVNTLKKKYPDIRVTF